MSDTRPGGAPAHLPDGEAPPTPAARGEREGAEPADTAPPGSGAPAGTPAPTTPGGG
ncbi:MAG: hypothetical protein QOG45_1549, partial [Chloroflexota bacterium]|nr:hypothetical protein [Chloroflexota bacterium]